MNPTDRKERGWKLIEQMMGVEHAREVREEWIKACPDFAEYVVEFVSGEIWSRSGLDRRTKSLITVATMAALGRERALKLNVKMALHNGATHQDIMEALLHIAPYAGFPAAWEGLATAAEVVAEEKKGD
ncbi:Carboxymuconolactone decarboxylase family protein [Planctomycetes bacterium Pan216]|uniref:Carboxymuconolactone decarboxylase family protein n=1 Tax=Kolteria novifilia TaxID=2527975 RepID=A0A518B5K2_9BACT|nr:Carboxymuconolactone decarboxylase family protein [Planctomycetes bacterium Pan216]